MLQHGLEQAEFLGMLAPKLLLMAAAREGFFPVSALKQIHPRDESIEELLKPD